MAGPSSIQIPGRAVEPSDRQLSFSTSPTATFTSPPSSFPSSLVNRTKQQEKTLQPFETQNIKILLLENVNQSGQDILTGQGYQVEAHKSSMPESELIEMIRHVTAPPAPPKKLSPR